MTAKQIVEVQKVLGVSADGIAGKITRSALEKQYPGKTLEEVYALINGHYALPENMSSESAGLRWTAAGYGDKSAWDTKKVIRRQLRRWLLIKRLLNDSKQKTQLTIRKSKNTKAILRFRIMRP